VTGTGAGISRRSFLAALAAVGGAGALAGCGGAASAPGTIRYWGIAGEFASTEAEMLAAFAQTDAGRDVTITKSTVPSNGTGDATSVITAVRGGTAPDVWYMDRFSAAQYAALGLLEPIDDMITRNGGDVDEVRSRFVEFAVDELTYDGKLYGVPTECDTRGLYYNKGLLRENGVDPDELDPTNGPPTLQRVLEISDQVTKRNARGDYTQMGLIPWDAEGWGITWALGYGARFFDDASCSVDLVSEPTLKAYEFLYDQARRLDFPRVDAFKATYEPPNHPPAQTSFYGGQQGFIISTNTYQQSMRKYVPDLEFGATYLPLPEAGSKPYTWSGGFALVCPKGSSLSREVWDFMSFYTSAESQAIYVPQTFTQPTNLELVQSRSLPVLQQELSFFVSQQEFTRSRPPIPVGQLWWDSMSAAQENVKLGSRDARAALEAAQARVAPQMQLYCPFTLPPGYGQPTSTG
jgi:multiple sugar transport system substrate-binding protein